MLTKLKSKQVKKQQVSTLPLRRIGDSNLNLSPGVITGQVTDTKDRYIDEAYVSIIDENRQVRASEKTAPDGRYTLGGILAG